MFEELDNPLEVFRRTCVIILLLLGIGGVVGGFFVMTEVEWWIGLLVWLATALVLFFGHLSYTLVVAFLSDIKLIRNRLYEISSEDAIRAKIIYIKTFDKAGKVVYNTCKGEEAEETHEDSFPERSARG